MRLKSLLMFVLMMALMASLTVSAQDGAEVPEPMPTVTEVPQFDSQAYLRFGHFVPDGTPVDIFVDGESVAESVEFTQISDWQVIPSGNHQIAVSESSTSAANAIFERAIDTAQDTWMTLGIVETEGEMGISLIQQAMQTDLPGTAQVTFANTLSSKEAVDFTRDDVIFVAGVPVTTGEIVNQNSIPVDAHTITYNLQLDGEPVAEGVEVETVSTSSYLVVAAGSADDPQLLIDETPSWRMQLLRGSLEAPGTLLEAMETEPEAEPFLEALEAANLTDILTADDPITIFVPASFVMDDVDLSREDLANVLRHHIVEGNYKAGDLFLEVPQLTTLDGDTLSLDGQFIDGVEIIDVDLAGSNGTIHIINNLLTTE